MALLDEADRRRVREALEAAERATRAEFVTVIARRADDYILVSLVAAAVVAFLASGLLILASPAIGAVELFALQAVVFAIAALLYRWPPLLMSLVPARVRNRRARRMAHEAFVELGVVDTSERTGIMLFVSAQERYVEIIADRGVQRFATDDAWQSIVDDFVVHVRQGAVADGFVAAVGAIGTLLARHLPAEDEDRNELADHLIEL